MTAPLTLIHTAEGHRATFDALAPARRLHHIVRPDWLDRARTGADADLGSELTATIRAAQGRVLCTCTTLGPLAEAAGATRVDWPMMQAAARLGGPVLMAYAVDSTLAPSGALLERAFEQAGKTLEVTLLDLTDLWTLFEDGDADGFADGIAARATRRPVLTSPELALRACLAPVAAR